MDISRRLFCGASGAVMASQLLVGQSSAQNEITVTGHLASQADTDVGGVELYLSNVDTDDAAQAVVDSGGDITTTISEPGTFRVTIFDYSITSNEIPVIYSFENIEIGEDGDIGEFTIPKAYRVQIRCVDSDGNPIENLPVNFRAPNGTGASPGEFTTTADGYVKHSDAEENGVELVEEVGIEIQPPANPEIIDRLKRITVSDSDEITLTVSDYDQYISDIQKISKDPDAGFHFPYYLYTPSEESVTNSGDSTLDTINPRPLVVGFRTWDSASEREEKISQGRTSIQRGKARLIADELNTPAMVALLPSSTEDEKFELLNRDSLRISEPPYERLDLQVLAMIDDAKQRLSDQPYDIANKVHLDGFSNNGRLVDQLSILHPDRINAVSSGGDGFHTIPKSEYEGQIPVQNEPETTTLEWPVGTAGLADLIGNEFNKEAWLDTGLYYYIGGEDQGDVDKSNLNNEYIHAKSYRQFGERRQQLLVDIFGWKQVDERFETSRQIFETLGANATFKIYDGVGHSVTREMVDDLVSFHSQQMVSEFPTDETLAADPDTEPADESADESSEATTDTQPGFGVIQTVATLGGLGYLIQNRMKSQTD